MFHAFSLPKLSTQLLSPVFRTSRDSHRATSFTNGARVPAFRQFLNLIGCVLALLLYYFTTAHSRYPITLDIIVTIAFTELNRYVIEGCRVAFRGRQQHNGRAALQEKRNGDTFLEGQSDNPTLECLAAVVGWREDPSLYARALESYKSSKPCVFLLAGVDGDEAEDQDMIKVFNKVCALVRRWCTATD